MSRYQKYQSGKKEKVGDLLILDCFVDDVKQLANL